MHKQFTSMAGLGALLLGGATLLAPAGTTLAVDAAETSVDPAAGLEEVVVSARRREESLQDVPVAVSAVGAEEFQRAFVTDTTQLAQFAPNVVLDKVEAGTAGGAAFSIRGISYQDVEHAFDPTVLVFVDEVAIGTGTGNVMSLLDIERIEILRGPQGTLFGKNAVGGIVNVHRKKPELGATGGKVRATFGDFDTQNYEGYVNFGGETAALKLNAARLEHDGYYWNETVRKWQDDREEDRYGAHVLWQPSDSLTFELQGNYIRQEGTANPVLNISDDPAVDGSGDTFCAFLGQCSDGAGQPQSGDKQVAVGDGLDYLELDIDSYIANVTWDINDTYALTYIGGYLDSFDDTAFDFDGSPATIYHARKESDYTQRSHELRVTRTGEVVSGQAGLYFWDADSYSINVAPALFDRAWTSSKSFSVYGEGDFRFMERNVLTAGFRYIEEDKELEKYVDDGQGNASIPPGTKAKRTDDDVIWRLGLRHEFEGGNMVYATYSTGFRSGGFSPRAATVEVMQRGQDPESLTNYEAGLRSRWLDNRLQLNLTLFHMIYDDMQIETSLPSDNPDNPQQQGFDNVGKATIDGVELDFVGRVTDDWTLSGSLGLLDAGYDEFYTDLFATGTPEDFTHLELRRAPDVTYTVASDYARDIGPGNAHFRVSYNWRSDYEGTLDNHSGTAIDAFGVLDASLSYSWGNWTAALFGTNLTDEDAYSHTYAVVPNSLGGTLWKFATPRVPRNYGVQVTYEFGR
ncbi:MAG TPA: TonB-dependent receptor [Steroidobacteraceae bacterium]|nr:TonB-dependent receptor [Steroidobacteraceae bacterium]